MTEYTWDSIFAVHEYFAKSQLSLNHLKKLSVLFDNPYSVQPMTCFGLYWEMTGHPFRKNILNSEESLKEIKYLFLQNLDLDDIFPIKVLNNLEIICSYNNSVDSLVPLKRLDNLKQIDFNKNKINNLEPISNLTNLEIIDLQDNYITNIGKLYNLIHLKELYLGGNKIQDIQQLSNLGQLKKLDLSHNEIVNIIELSNLKKLETLYLNGNNMKISKIIELGRSMRNCKIFFGSEDFTFDFSLSIGYLYFKVIDNIEVPFFIDLKKNNRVKYITVVLLDKTFKLKNNIIEEMKEICRRLIAIDDREDYISGDTRKELFLEVTSDYVSGQFD